MHILITNINGNPNVGLYGYCNDKYCLLGLDVSRKKAREIEKILKVPVHRLNIAGTSLVGVFCAGNNSCLLLPNIVFEDELKQLDKLKIKYKVIDTKLTALGNNVLCNDNGAFVNPNFSAVQKKKIRQALNVKVVPGQIAELDTTGSLGILNEKGCLLHRDTHQRTIKFLEGLLKIKCDTGSVNLGNPFVSSGVLCNSNGFVVGNQSGGPEISHIDHVLGFIKG